MKKYIYLLLVAFLFGGFSLITSCGAEEEEEEEVIPEDQLITTATEIKLDLVMGHIPSPTKLTAEIPKSGANYDKSILNPTGKAASYSTNYQQGMNLGIYIADLSYASVYNQSQDATQYIGVAMQLADKLGISKAFNPELLKSFKTNVNNADSMVGIIDIAYENADKFLRSNDRVSTAALVLAGGWIEGLYISTKIIGDAERVPENESLYKSIGQQKFALKDLLELLETYRESPDHAKLIESLELIEVSFDKVPQPSKIIKPQVMEIAEKVASVRNEMIS